MHVFRSVVAVLIPTTLACSAAVAQPADICGTLESGFAGCMHIRTDSGTVYLLTPRPTGHEAGERVRAVGPLNTSCTNFCQLTTSCIQDPVITPCPDNTCRADTDRSGALGVQDIFSFLAAYFSGSLTADFDNSGALSVQDIFSFLAAFFAGCP